MGHSLLHYNIYGMIYTIYSGVFSTLFIQIRLRFYMIFTSLCCSLSSSAAEYPKGADYA